MKSKFKRDNAVTIVRILTLRQRICDYNTIWGVLVKDREAARIESDSINQCLSLMKEVLGVGYELYGDEEEIALQMASEDGVAINWDEGAK